VQREFVLSGLADLHALKQLQGRRLGEAQGSVREQLRNAYDLIRKSRVDQSRPNLNAPRPERFL